MKLNIVLLLSVTILPITGCIHDSDANDSNNIAFTVVSSGNQTGISGQQMRVINTSEQLSSLLSSITISGDIPNPDFTKTSLITIFSGSNSGCGDGLTVTSVENNGATVIVKASMSLPGSGTICPAFVPNDSPYAFIEIDKTTKPISLLVDVEIF